MHKHSNTNTVIRFTNLSIQHTNIIQLQWQNKSFTGNIYNKIPSTRQTPENHFLKCASVSNITYIQLVFTMNHPPQYIELIPHIITESFMKYLVLFLVILFSFGFHVAQEALVRLRDFFGVISNLLPHPELLMYAKPIHFLVGSTNVYGIIFDQVYLLTCLTIFFFSNCG